MRSVPLSRWVWVAGLLLHVGLIAVLFRGGPGGWVASVPLLVILPWLIRRSSYAYAVNSLLVLWYIGGGLALRDLPGGLAVACLGAALFLCSTTFVRFSAVERRRELAMQSATGVDSQKGSATE